MHHTLRKNPDLTGRAAEVSVFSEDECEDLISEVLRGESNVDNPMTYVLQERDYQSLYFHIKKVFLTGNFLRFHYNEISIEVMRFREGFYCPPHTDWSTNDSRKKLSMVMGLSHIGDYAGGETYIHTDEPIELSVNQGVATIFPSWTMYEVAPIISGEKWVLFAWAEGPPFI
jgi:predicted 2-oxoglutarate/Fe(II)-dependent dioxygenase YbiX